MGSIPASCSAQLAAGTQLVLGESVPRRAAPVSSWYRTLAGRLLVQEVSTVIPGGTEGRVYPAAGFFSSTFPGLCPSYGGIGRSKTSHW